MNNQIATDINNRDFWIGKEHGITLDGETITPYYSVFVDDEVIKYQGLADNYPYTIAQYLAKDHPNASIKLVAYVRTF